MDTFAGRQRDFMDGGLLDSDLRQLELTSGLMFPVSLFTPMQKAANSVLEFFATELTMTTSATQRWMLHRRLPPSAKGVLDAD